MSHPLHTFHSHFMFILQFNPDHHVAHEAMTFQFQYLDDASDRNIRDYVILRDYVKALEFIRDIFIFVRNQELEKELEKKRINDTPA